MLILAIDPGTEQSGWVLYYPGGAVHDADVWSNEQILTALHRCTMSGGSGPFAHATVFALEVIRARGEPTSNAAYDTLIWCGRFIEAWRTPKDVMRIDRAHVKIFVCGRSNVKDANVNAGLREMVGQKGTKKNPGPTFHVSSHAWAALGVAVTAANLIKGGNDAPTGTADRGPAHGGRPRVRI